MADVARPIFTADELSQAIAGNASALPYVMVALARQFGRTPDEGAALVGRLFAPGWQEAKGRGAREIARMMALNKVSCGAEVRSLIGDDTHAEARLVGLPTEDDAAFFGLSMADVDCSYGTVVPIAESLGLAADWRRDGDEIVITVRRGTAP
jgi:hypothetical protein